MLEASPFWISVSILISLSSHFARGWRWALMLSPLGYRISPFKAFLAVMVGYLVNIPTARLGEVARCALLKKSSDVPFEASFGAIVAERLMDLSMLFIISAFTFFLEYDKVGVFIVDKLGWAAEGLLGKMNFLVILGIIFLIFITFLWIFRQKIINNSLFMKLKKVVLNFKDGFLGIRQLSRSQLSLFLFLTFSIWVLYFFMSYTLFFSKPETTHLGMKCALTLLVMSGLGVTIPTPGGFGSYHLFVIFTLTVYGLAEESSKSFAFLMHSSQLFSLSFFGLISLIISMLYNKNKTKG
ncbi:MAG: lysylphosphatidylglycerol synthase transmembrane domain-containing protein [Flammeovirgaceae bacterium]